MKIIFIHDTTYYKEDTTVASIAEGLYENGVEVIASHLGNGIKKAYTEDEIIEHSKDADFIFYLWRKTGGKYGPLGVDKQKFVKKLNRPEITLFFDGSEWNYTGTSNASIALSYGLDDKRRYKQEPWMNEEMLDYCKWYLKRECYPEDVERGAIPFTYGCENSMFRNYYNLEKKSDIFCSFGHFTTGLRSDIYNFCSDPKANKFYDTTYNIPRNGPNHILGTRIPLDDYFKVLSQSYISVAAWGAVNFTHREWETMANKTLCFIQKPMPVCPNRPKDGIHWVEYSNMKEFEEKLEYYLSNKDLCIKIGQAGYDHVLKYHTSKVKVANLLKTIGGIV